MAENNLIPQFNRIHISKGDFEEALVYVKLYKDELSDVIKRALISSAIIAYSRPFCKNNGPKNRSVPFILGGYQKRLSANQIKIHKLILSLRNKAIAHSDYQLKPTHPSISDGTVIQWSKPFDILNELSKEKLNLLLFQENIECLIRFTIDKIYELQDEIVKQFPG